MFNSRHAMLIVAAAVALIASIVYASPSAPAHDDVPATPFVGGLLSAVQSRTLFTVEEGDTAQTVDWTNGNAGILDLDAAGGDVTVTFVDPTTTANTLTFLSLTVVQDDSVGGYNIVWPSNVKWPNDAAPTITATVSKVDEIGCRYFATPDLYRCALNQNYAQ